jgi:beta-N-acetylhexosaminidase
MKITLLDPSMSKEDIDRVVQSTAGSSSVIVAAYATVNAGRGDVALAGQYPALMSALMSGPVPVTLAALGNPYLLRNFPDVKAYLTTYSTTSTSETSLAKALFGEMAISGRLPVTIPGIAKYGDGIQLPSTNSNPKGL